MKSLVCFSALALLLFPVGKAGFLNSLQIKMLRLPRLAAIAATAVSVASALPMAASAAQEPDSHHRMYFGVGCFWHVQHEFVEAERRLLQRGDGELTSLTGYAGGNGVGKDKLVCYHNMKGASDYGSLGYTEAVQLDVPDSGLQDFFRVYLGLFRNQDRPDVGDKGPEYRSVVGIPGGVGNSEFAALQEMARREGLQLVEGKGGDPDSLGKKLIYVLDSEEFAFKPAEVYHQFHDGFMLNEQYPQTYNDLRGVALDRGVIKPTGCPENFLF